MIAPRPGRPLKPNTGRKRRPLPDISGHTAAALAYVRRKSLATDTGCWEWQGHRNRLGYGEGCFRNRQWMAHRLAYVAAKGPFDPQLDVCHSCDNRWCVNPEHLWIGTMQQNILDCVAKGRHNKATKTHCANGHEYTEESTYVCSRGFRQCRICVRVRQRIKAGWPEELAHSMPPVPHGYSPVKGKFPRKNKNWRQRKAELAASRAVHSDTAALSEGK